MTARLLMGGLVLSVFACSASRENAAAPVEPGTTEAPPVEQAAVESAPVSVDSADQRIFVQRGEVVLWDKELETEVQAPAQLSGDGRSVVVLTRDAAHWFSVDTGEEKTSHRLNRMDEAFVVEGKLLVVRRGIDVLSVFELLASGKESSPLHTIPIVLDARGGGVSLRETTMGSLRTLSSKSRSELALVDAAGRLCVLRLKSPVSHECFPLRHPLAASLVEDGGFRMPLASGAVYRLEPSGKTSLSAPARASLGSRMDWSRRLYGPVEALAARGAQAWALVHREEDVSGYLPGGLFHLGKASASEWRFRHTRSALGELKVFYASASGPRALLQADYCCGEASLDLFTWQNKMSWSSCGAMQSSPCVLCLRSAAWRPRVPRSGTLFAGNRLSMWWTPPRKERSGWSSQAPCGAAKDRSGSVHSLPLDA